MNIERINDVVFEYIVKMIKDDEDIDIYDIKEEQYDDDIKDRLFNRWECGYDIIAEYFGNQSIFEPTLSAFIDMLNFVKTSYFDATGENVDYDEILVRNRFYTYQNLLRRYAYWYIYTMPFEDFKLKLKDYVEDENE